MCVAISISGSNFLRMVDRQLDRVTADLSNNLQRLSSGMRINKASDDAAGLSIAVRLNADSLIFRQAIKNINDGVSLLNIADGSVSQLNEILIRLKELATQGANGSFSSAQRSSIDEEADELVNEYNRIIKSVDFNNLKLLDGSVSNVVFQAGYGANSTLSVRLGYELGGGSTIVGDGTFQAATSYISPSYSTTAVDINGDGIIDLVSAADNNNKIKVLLGNGNGTFRFPITFVTATNPRAIAVGDYNGDGKLDVAAITTGGGDAEIFLGNGNGTFTAYTSFALGTVGNGDDIQTADVNGDGVLDLVAGRSGNAGYLGVLLGNGNGSFRAVVSYVAANAVANDPDDISLADFNGDGKLDILTTASSQDTANVLLGNGDGTFNAMTSFSTGDAPQSSIIADANSDGYLDIITTSALDDKINVLLGNGNGSFKARISYSAADGATSLAARDLNGDGYLDVVTLGDLDNLVHVLLGNSDGSFKASTTYAISQAGDGSRAIALADFNGDGAIDIAANASDTGMHIYLANPTEQGNNAVKTISQFNLNSASSSRSALDTLDNLLQRVSNETGALGAAQGRLGIAIKNLSQMDTVTLAARSRILDVDVGLESAQLVRNQIQQSIGAALHAQANQIADIVLQLLRIE